MARTDYPLGHGTGVSPWRPEEILHFKLDVRTDLQTMDVYYPVSEVKLHKDIKDVVKEIFNVPILDHRDMDFIVRRPCYVIFELSHNQNWQFRNGHNGMSLKNNDSEHYTDLTHVDASDPTIWNATAGPGCRILFFKVVKPKENGDDPFNLHLDADVNMDGTLPSVDIDPDIKNDGGHPFVRHRGHRTA